VVYDVGAQLGLYGMYLAKEVAPHGFAFQPAEAPRRITTQNLIANGISNVVIDPRACSDVVGEVPFYIS
jgi:FkbM family methyltransferase